MSESGPDLGRVLALCAFGYNERARQCLLRLLPDALAETVGAAWRSGDALLAPSPDPIEEQLAAPWREQSSSDDEPPEDAVAEDAAAERAAAEGADGEEEALETGDAQTGDAQTGDAQTGDSEIDAFFAAGDALAQEAADSTVVDSQLPAVLLARLMVGAEDELAARLLGDLPLNLQGEVVVTIARHTPLSVRHALRPEEQDLLQSLRDALPDREPWGIGPVCEILRALDGTPPLRRALTSAAETDDEVATVIQSHLFEFEDLIRLRDQELQALLGACDNADLARALFDTGSAIRDRVIANVSDRRAALLEDEADLHTEATPDEIELSQRTIMARARVLYERGTITTYLGSIHSQTQDVEDVEEEEEEERAGGTQEKRPSPSARDRRKRRSLVPRLVAAAAVLVFLVGFTGLIRWMTTSDGPSTRQVRSAERRATRSSQRIALTTETLTTETLTTETLTTETPTSESSEGEDGNDGQTARRLQESEQIRVPPGADALLEFPTRDGTTRVQAEAGARLQRLPDTRPREQAGPQAQTGLQEQTGEAPPVASFYLRVGRVKVTVAAPRFIVRTPAGRIEASRGSVFRVRVVLDGSMQVHALGRGDVTVVGAGSGRTWSLNPGERLEIDVDGDGRVVR